MKKILIISDDYDGYRLVEGITNRNVKRFYNQGFELNLVNDFFHSSIFSFFNKKNEVRVINLFDIETERYLHNTEYDIIVIDFGLVSYGKREERCIRKLLEYSKHIFLTSATAWYVEKEIKDHDFYSQFSVVGFDLEEMPFEINRLLDSLQKTNEVNQDGN